MAEKTEDEIIEDLRTRGFFVTKNPNRYDRRDMVRMESQMKAGPFQMGAYRVRDPETLEWSTIQFHMTFNNYVIGVMSIGEAKLFSRFVDEQVKRTEAGSSVPGV